MRTVSPTSLHRLVGSRNVLIGYSRCSGLTPVSCNDTLSKWQCRAFRWSPRLFQLSSAGSESTAALEAYRKQLSNKYALNIWPDFHKLARESEGNESQEIKVDVFGYIGTTRIANKKLKFAELVDPSLRQACQLVFSKDATTDFDSTNIPSGSPVSIRAILRRKPRKSNEDFEKTTSTSFGLVDRYTSFELLVEQVNQWNEFPNDTIVSIETNFPPEQRHLQIRTSSDLRETLRKRSEIMQTCRRALQEMDFQEVETPLLFKSTPEGAREFLVPTRQKGKAYALPQSPQQYKQLLISSGIPRYFQFAKCFRDEDMRADRQPEFTQLDLEMAFANFKAIKDVMESMVASVWDHMGRPAEREEQTRLDGSVIRQLKFETMTYQQAMTVYGSDKPDLRYRQYPIQQTHHNLPPQTFVSMMTSLENPTIDFLKMDETFDSMSIREFLDSPAASLYHSNPAGPPAVLTVDTSKPLNGLSALGHEYAEQFMNDTQAEPGDTFIFQARENAPFYEGSTALGDLRRDLIKFGLKKGLLEKAKKDALVWIIDFPLFKPSNDSEPGQGGNAGIQSTHHPFTAPKLAEDFDHMLSEPLRTTGEHYDLVINGVEVGGGSKRIHSSVVQEHVLRDVLELSPERVEDFRHLLEALRVGCPPHAGIALGFDRLMAIICDKESVRDVIAFPKWGTDAEDKLVKAPSTMTQEQLKTYHLSVQD